MSDPNSQAEALGWLHEQIGELDRWRSELIGFSEGTCSSTLEKLDAHRDWLEKQLMKLGSATRQD